MYQSIIFYFCLTATTILGISVPSYFHKVDIAKIGTQEHLFPFLAGSAPYFDYPTNYSIPRDLPDDCQLTQVQVLARHGERYPTNSTGRKIINTWYKLNNYTRDFEGSLSFLNSYEFFLKDKFDQFEALTTQENSISPLNPYLGEYDAKRHALEFSQRYESILRNVTDLTIFTSNSKRVYDTAKYFSEALGDGFNISLAVLDEDPSSGANTLTPGYSCPKWNENDGILEGFNTDYLTDIVKRLGAENKGLNLTTTDAYNLFNWCAFEISLSGYSEMCSIFKIEELIQFSYYNDVANYYSDFVGNPLIKAIGSVLFNSSMTLLSNNETTAGQNIWISFTHDTDMLNYMAVLGIMDNNKNLTVNSVPFQDHIFHKGWLVPTGARLYTEKFQCSKKTNDSSVTTAEYVRHVLNDVVIPIESCHSGPGFSCELHEFLKYGRDRIRDADFYKNCGVRDVSNTTELTFYWDYKNKPYNSSLILQ